MPKRENLEGKQNNLVRMSRAQEADRPTSPTRNEQEVFATDKEASKETITRGTAAKIVPLLDSSPEFLNTPIIHTEASNADEKLNSET